ncbi:MAG TPA: hypothetical protein VIM16_14715 [Mucilaginibacter sp.]|jgi:uncharacterized protein Yka (UPF0111/DUF47 family)
MYLEAKETARLYKLLSEKLGNDTTEAMFKYIDNKTERSVEATIKTLATKDDIANLRKEISNDLTKVRNEIADVRYDLRKDIGESKADNIKWMFIFWIGQVGATLAIVFLFLKK